MQAEDTDVDSESGVDADETETLLARNGKASLRPWMEAVVDIRLTASDDVGITTA